MRAESTPAPPQSGPTSSTTSKGTTPHSTTACWQIHRLPAIYLPASVNIHHHERAQDIPSPRLSTHQTLSSSCVLGSFVTAKNSTQDHCTSLVYSVRPQATGLHADARATSDTNTPPPRFFLQQRMPHDSLLQQRVPQHGLPQHSLPPCLKACTRQDTHMPPVQHPGDQT